MPPELAGGPGGGASSSTDGPTVAGEEDEEDAVDLGLALMDDPIVGVDKITSSKKETGLVRPLSSPPL